MAKTQSPSSYGLTKKKIMDLIATLENKAPENAAKLKKEFGITDKKKMMGGGAAIKKKTKYMAKGGMKKTKYMAKGGATKKTKMYAKGGAAKKK